MFPDLQVANQIYWCQEVEEAFEKMSQGDEGAMRVRLSKGPGA